MKKLKLFSITLIVFSITFFNYIGVEAASMQEGTPGQTIHGEYVVIVNTDKDSTSKQSTGTLNLDSSVKSSSKVATSTSEMSKNNIVQSTTNTSTSRAITKYNIGDKKVLYQGKEYTCIGEGEHCYIWMETSLKTQYDNLGKTQMAAQDMMAVYDGKPYKILNELSSGNIVYQDNSGKLSILLEEMTTSSGFFAGEPGITAIHIKTKKPDQYKQGDFSSTNGLLVHEGQHALFLNNTCKDSASVSNNLRWLNEALAVASMDWYWGGDDPSGWLDLIKNSQAVRNGSSLFYSTYRNDNAQDYGLPYLFVRYLINQASHGYDPVKFIQNVYKVDATRKR